MGSYGILSLVPVICVIILVFITRRTMASLVAGSVIGAVILYGKNFFMEWINAIYAVLGDGTWQWLFLVCGLFGSIIALFEASGGALGFSRMSTRLCKSKKQALFMTWILDLVVFADDWLNALAVSSAMRNVTDKFRIPRELLAYVICTTGPAICTLVPFSTWGVFMAGQLESNGVAAAGEGFTTYLHTLPYVFYAIISIIAVPLYIIGVIPHFGRMKKAELRAETTGYLLPEYVHNMVRADREADAEAEEAEGGNKGKAINFLIPLIVLAVVTTITKEMLYGIFACFVVCAVMYFPQKLLTLTEFLNSMVSGFKDMLGVIGIISSAFILKEMNNALGLPAFVIGLVENALDPRLLPAVAFIVVGLLCFAAGNFWGMLAIAFPVIIPIALSLDADLILVSGAMISGCVFGCCACFYGSEVSLVCDTTKVPNQEFARTALPLYVVPVGISLILFLIFGFVQA